MENSEQIDLVKFYTNDTGYSPWFNSIDWEVAGESKCEKCGHVGLDFAGFQGYRERHAVAICKKCGHQEEF